MGKFILSMLFLLTISQLAYTFYVYVRFWSMAWKLGMRIMPRLGDGFWAGVFDRLDPPQPLVILKDKANTALLISLSMCLAVFVCAFFTI